MAPPVARIRNRLLLPEVVHSVWQKVIARAQSRRGYLIGARGIDAGWPETLRGSVREPGAAPAARAENTSTEQSSAWKPDFLPGLCQGVVDSDLKHRTTRLKLLRSCPGSISGREFGFQLAVDFEHVTGSRQSTGGCDHFIPFGQFV